MMRSMYSGVAGLKTHQTKMDVIGNNIANVNTVAYKSQSVTFAELMYQTTQAASGANAATGRAGINARQIGLGVKAGAINTAISTQGASQTTNNPFDIRITGSNFFVVSDGNSTFFTRDGSFYVDGLGNLAMTSNGYNVMGWQVDPTTGDIKQDTVSALRIMNTENLTYEPEATTKGKVTGILDKNDTNLTSSSGKIVNMLFYDKLGYSYTAKFTVKDTAKEGEYSLQLTSILDSENNPVAMGGVSAGAGFTENKDLVLGKSDNYVWDTAGTKLYKASDVLGLSEPYPATIDPAADLSDGDISDEEWETLATAYNSESVSEFKSRGFTQEDKTGTADASGKYPELKFSVEDYFLNNDVSLADGSTAKARDLLNVTDMNAATVETQTVILDGAVSLTYDPTTGKFSGIGGKGNNSITLSLSQVDPAGRFEDIDVDFSLTTMFNNSGTSTITASNGDHQNLGTGRKLGVMTGVTIQNDGRIYASYDNGMSRLLGQIATAEFANASGLAKEGDNLYTATQNSGAFDGIGVEVTSGGGYMTTGVLEMSNVDLSAEFTEMITTQRGFQANSRIITVSDTLLEELVNLKR